MSRKHRKKIRLVTSSFRGAHSRLTIHQHKIKVLVSAHWDRDRKKRYFRRLWISRINAVIRENKNEKDYSYSIFMYNLYKKQLLINRKILAQIAILNRNCFSMIVNEIIK
uniref:50S ribosomal protein L20 n=1 Tax=Daniellia ogea TaxID=162734 RepID=A0A6H0E7D3_9FABA|nr:ribosomal protein L20 [Daniellia ogea]QIS98140.1 ribosomal protein L20 [Daniellia ogea]